MKNNNFQNKNINNVPFYFKSKNMSYIYNCLYYEEMLKKKQEIEEEISREQNEKVKERLEKQKEDKINYNQSLISRAVIDFTFLETKNRFNGINDLYSFELKTTNPGLLVGSGNFGFGAKEKESFKLGFSFDYVTGLPYIPGSSIKGAIRSYFPENHKNIEKINFIKQLLNKDDIDVFKLEDIFDNEIVFLDAYPIVIENGRLLAEDYITPHKVITENPIPIKFIKVKPRVSFRFNFIIKNDIPGIYKQEIVDLFENIIIFMGLGAKTNVGYGRFEK